jgi:Domain of Unknown Function with PDB structure (DUF3857)/Transglutaminase-like superfamily/Domain of Unknown Function with PDB structure (DUF3858)
MKFFSRTIIVFLFLTLVFFAEGFSQKRKAKPTISPKPTPNPTFIKTGVVNERFIVNYKIAGDGTSVRDFELIRRYDEEPHATDEFKNFEDEFNSDLESIAITEAYLLKADGRKLVVPKEKITINPKAEFAAASSFTSLKTLKVKFAEIKKGDRVYFKMTKRQLKPVFAGVFDSFDYINPFESYELCEINVVSPSAMGLKFDMSELKGGKSSDINGLASYQWKLEKYPAKNYEIAMQYSLNFGPRLIITSLENFEKIGKTFTKEAANKYEITPELQTLADDITKDHKTPEAQAEAIYDWVNKNVRYLAIVLDRGGWIPNDATTIAANRYGDCKDYTILIKTLLKAKNIDSIPMVVRADETNWFTTVPSIYFFNHMILYIPSLNKFADATTPNSNLGEISDVLYGKQGVLLGTNGSILSLPVSNKNSNSSKSNSKVELQLNGNAKATTDLTLMQSLKSMGMEKNDSETKRNFSLGMRLLFARFEIDATTELIELKKIEGENDVTNMKLETVVNRFIDYKKTGSFEVPQLVNFANWGIFKSIIESEKRTTPINLGQIATNELYEIKFPKGIKIESVPSNVNFENSIGSYVSDYKIIDNVVFIKRDFAFKKKSIEISEYLDFREFLQRALADVKSQITYSLTEDFDLKNIAKKVTKKKENLDDLLTSVISESIFSTEKLPKLKEIPALEGELLKNPNDAKTRRKLIAFYAENDQKIEYKNKLVKHLIWLVEKFPEDYTDVIQNQFYYSSTDADYIKIRDAWLKQLTSKPKVDNIRLNLSKFAIEVEPVFAEKLLLEGVLLNPENYEFHSMLFEILKERFDDQKEQPDVYITDELLPMRVYSFGEKAWILSKTDRSPAAELIRSKVLRSLSKHALDVGKLEPARKMATELVLEFAGDDDSAHIGNTVFGLLALKEKNVIKAKEYLMISVNVPLQAEKHYLKPDMELAKELLLQGEKEIVLEYLAACRKLKYFSQSYTIAALEDLKRWELEIKRGRTPSFKYS